MPNRPALRSALRSIDINPRDEILRERIALLIRQRRAGLDADFVDAVAVRLLPEVEDPRPVACCLLIVAQG